MREPGRISVRPASASDGLLLLEWANDPVTRKAGFHPGPINPDDHRRWLADRLTSDSGCLLVAMDRDVPVGQIRLDRLPDGRVEIGISVAATMRGRGVGRTMLTLALDWARTDAMLHPTAFLARIRPDNAASIALFTGAGFRLIGRTEIRGESCLLYEARA